MLQKYKDILQNVTFRNCWIGMINYSSKVNRYNLIHCYFLNIQADDLGPQIEMVVENP